MAIWWALFAMICWGLAPLFAKLGLYNMTPMAGLIMRTLFAAGMISAWSMVSGNTGQLREVSPWTWIPIGIEAILATLVGDLAYYSAIKYGDVAVVTMIMSTSPLITLVGAWLVFGEPITMYRALGAGFIITGIILIR
ncbi:MAG: EamA family transporter [Solirubrobacterales bacterium]